MQGSTSFVLDFMKIKHIVVWKTVLREQQGRLQIGIIYFLFLLVPKDLYPENLKNS